MLRMPSWRLLALAAVVAANSGCSDGPVAKIDQGATIAKVSGGDGSARVSPKARQASDAAAKLHPKLH